MGTLTVDFLGICTHFPTTSFSDTGITLADSSVQWRVVLVQGINGRLFKSSVENKSMAIPPHDASMLLGQSRIAATLGSLSGLRQITPFSYLLRGVRITVANPTTPQAFQTVSETVSKTVSEPFTDAIPSLHKYAQPSGTEQVQLTLADHMVTGEAAAAFFDISYGTLTAYYNLKPEDKVAHVVYTVDTIGAPRLNVQTFYDGTISVIDFADQNPQIIVQNTGEQKDTFYDFTLHYLVCTDIPSTVTPPGSAGEHHVDGLGSGCSNSNWP